MSSQFIRGFSIMFALLLSAGSAYATIGTVQFTAGDVTIRDSAGKLRGAKKGDSLNEGDTILTGTQASAQLKMSDGGILAVRPQSELRIDRYKYSGKEDGTENAFMSLVKGGFRTITGIIGRANKDNYKVGTATATIGIRGTDHEPFFVPSVPPGAPQPSTPPGTYNKVNVGVAFIATPLGTINIAQNQVGFAAPNQPPQLLPVMPEFFKATPPINQAQQQKEAEPSEVRSTAIVDNTSSPTASSTTTTTTTDTSSSTPAITQTVSGTSSSSLDVDLTNQTISGVALLSTASTLTPGALSNFNGSTNVRNETVYSTQAIGGAAAGDIFFGSIRDVFSGLTTNTGFNYTGPRTSNNVMFDAVGNLVRIFNTGYVIFDHATDVAAGTTNFRVPTPLANAQLSFGASGSVAAERFEYTPTGYTDPIIRLGRWQGGAINVLDTLTGNAYLDPILGSAHWLVRQGVPSFAGVTGTHHYSRVAATSPTDHYGNIGTLDAARLSVDFNRMLVSLGLRVSMPGFGGYLLTARAEEAPIVGGGFNVSTGDLLNVGCYGAGCAPNQSYGGRVRGAFAGEAAAGAANNIEGAYYRYTFNTNYPGIGPVGGRANEEYINGYVAFGRDPAAGVGSTIVTPTSNPALFSVNAPGPNPPGDAVILNAYAFTNPLFSFTETRTNSFDAAGSNSRWGAFPPGYAIDGSGNLTFASHFFEGDNERITITGGTSPVNVSAQGITHGYVFQPTLSGDDWNGPFVNRVPLAAYHWLRGPALFPWYAGAVMTNAVNGSSVGYAQLGGLVTNQAGVAGSVTGTLQVNFNAQSVNTSINAIVSGGTFAATANGIALDYGGFFWAGSGGAYRHTMGLTFNGSSASTRGNLNGLLMNTTPGAAPNDGILGGAGVAFAFQGPAERATGTLVFGNPAYVTPPPDGSVFQPSALMDYRVLLVASGMGLGDAANRVPPPGSVTRDGTGSTPLVSEWDNYQVRFNVITGDRTQLVNSNTVTTPNPLGLVNPQGALIKFDGSETMIWNFCASGPQCNGETQLPTRYALADATGGGPTVTNGRVPATAVALETGYDAASGVRWGRWGGGFLNVGDRASASGAVAPPPGTAPATVDLRVQNWHYLITGSQAGPVTIPTTGTANYTLIGGTSPTAFTPGQSLPDVGTLGSVSLAVNFGTQQITTLQINASTPGSGNWNASNTVGGIPQLIPIIQKSAFFAEKSLTGVATNLEVTRNGSNLNTAGQVIGGFTNGATAAGLAYSLNQGGPVGTTISGVAVLRR